jgi:hypothetical protein
MFNNNKIPQSGLIPIKIENQGNLLTTQVNKINFTGSGVTASIGQFNDLSILINSGGGAGSGVTQIIAGTNISISPPGGTGVVTINASSTTVSASYALTSSYSNTSTSASYALSSSYSRTSTTSSYALTSSYSRNLVISGSINNVDYIDFNTGSAIPAWKSGRVFWDNTDGALSVYNAEQDITLQVGQENWTRVSNRTGATILNGTVVRLKGAHGDVPEVELAQSILVSGSVNLQNQILGVATHDIEDNSKGYITTQGLVRGLNTNAFNDGDTLFVGTGSAGILQNTAPAAPYEIIPVGVCVKASPGTSGIIYVAVQEPIDFSDLSSALVEGAYTYGDIWVYTPTGSVGVWKHTKQLSGSYSITGSLTISGSSTFRNIGPAIFSGSVTGTSGFTGSLQGTSSWASNSISSSYALSSSYSISSSYALSASLSVSSSRAVSASFAISSSQAVSSSYSLSSSYATNANYASSTPVVPSTLLVQGYLTGNQSIPNNTDTIINFERQFDPNLWLDIGTRRFIPTVAGYYLVSFGAWLENPASPTNQVNVQIRKSTGGGPTGTVMILQQPLNNGTGISLSGTRILYMDGVLDYLDFTIFQGSGSPKNLLYGGTPDGAGTWFSANLITM